MKRLLLYAVLAAALCASVALAWPRAKPVAAKHAAAVGAKSVAAKREHAAAVAARHLLHEFVAPPGASRTQRPSGYGGVLLRPGPWPQGEVAHRFGFWRVTGSFVPVVDYVRSHRPPGFRFSSESRSSLGQTPRSAVVSFRRHGTRFLNVTVVRLPGRIVIRVDALVAWNYPRSPHEKVPATVAEVDIIARMVTRHVTDAAQVDRIVSWFDALPVVPPHLGLICVTPTRSTIKLIFRSASGEQLASASGPAERAFGCDPFGFSVHRARMAPLVDGVGDQAFVYRVQRLLGVRLTDRP